MDAWTRVDTHRPGRRCETVSRRGGNPRRDRDGVFGAWRRARHCQLHQPLGRRGLREAGASI